MFHSIRWRIAVPYVILILLSMVGLTVYASTQVRNARLADLEAQLLAEARSLADTAQPWLVERESPDALDSLARRWAGLLGARVTIIGPDGTVLGESNEDRIQMDNHLSRPEIQQALASGQGSSIRFSQTAGYDMMYVAVAVRAGDKVAGFVRVALPLSQIETGTDRLYRIILTGGLLTALVAVLLALLIAERTAQPVRRLTQVAERVAEGDLNARLPSTSRDEVGHLTLAFNHMADQLQEKMTTLAREQNRLAAVLEHMADGILITDAAGQVQLINPAAGRLLGVPPAAALGRSFVQAVRDHRLVELWEECYERREEQTATLESSRLGKFLQVIITPLSEAKTEGRHIEGAQADSGQVRLVILQDLTQIRRLETVRRDFISNISHELRTPLASLKALVDTLRDGALDDPPAAQRFLNRIETEVDALTQIVQELLELSRIESGQVPLRLTSTRVDVLVNPPVERLRPQAERAGLEIGVTLPSQLPMILADAERAQQVVTNLVHNAVKFTPPGGKIDVSAEQTGDEVIISVSDTGVGIPSEDLPRIFERFYKADRARSGGGTGLGLAIAKHIVQGHGGRIWAESVVGRGSTFYFSFLTSE